MHSARIFTTLLACGAFLLIPLAIAIPPLPTPLPTPSAPPLPPPSVNPDESLPVVINYGQGQEARATIYRSLMEPVGLHPNQAVTVTLFCSPNKADLPVTLGLYDGGQVGAAALPGSGMITLGPLRVPAGGALQFNFQTDHTPGLYRVLVTIGGSQYLLQFYAVTSAGGLVPHPPPRPTPFPSPTPQ
jgi:hypothetical protein